MEHNPSVGLVGERLAAEFLKKKGYRVLDRNYRRPWGEIDIIARALDGTLVFVEVKTLRRPLDKEGLLPEDNVTAAKLMKLRRTGQLYAAGNKELVADSRGWRIDLVAVELRNALPPQEGRKEHDIRHYENI